MSTLPPCVAVDLGGTQIRAGLVANGRIQHRQARPTASERGVDAVIASMIEAIQEVMAATGRRDLPVGVAAPGPLDPRAGVILEAPNLIGWRQVPLGDRLAAATGTSVFIGNDANCAAQGEHRFGAGRGVSNLCYVTISTGIGGGVIIDGRVFEGTAGAAAEVGHMTLDLDGPRCGCGNLGCWEALASGPAIAAQAEAAVQRGEATVLAERRDADGHLTADMVAAAARRGDAVAAAVMRRAGTITGFGLVNLAHLFDPDLIVLGGGVMQAGDLILEPAMAVFERHAMANYRRACRVDRAALGEDVGLYGAAALVAERLSG